MEDPEVLDCIELYEIIRDHLDQIFELKGES